PGDEYLYCNTGYTLLAEVVARVSGQSFAAFTRENIFSPLQMNSTLFNDDHEKIIKNRAYSYYSRGNEGYFKRELNHGNVGPSNLLTTIEDFSLWMINFLNPKVGSSDIFKQMTTQGILNNGKSSGSAPGLFINDYRGLTEIEHGGAHAGFRAQVSMFPSQEFGVAILSNNANCNARMLASEVINFCLKDFFKENKPVLNEKERKYIKLKSKEMEPFVGYYWTKEHAYTRHIYLRGDTLMHFRTENNESPLAPVSKNEFQVMNVPVDALVRFEEQNGEIRIYETVNDRTPIMLEKFVPVDYSHEDWLKYEGEYYSDEIKTVYEIEWTGEKLIAKHIRMGNIGLKMIKHNFFSGERGFFGSVEFLRDKADN
ncbi:MAG: beta-lactamase family protein, partial [Bacteroidetes bacterium]|nr:beta-lactamase family protein [Bacteroidota bacterium]